MRPDFIFPAHVRVLLVLLLATVGPLAMAQVYFIPNEGQWDGDYLYKASFPGNTTFYLDDDHMAFTQVEVKEDHEDHVHHHGIITGGHHYRVRFVDALIPSISTADPSNHYENYFLGARSRWRSRVQPVGEVNLKSLYKGVDLKVYTRFGQLKYDLLADDASDLSQVKFYYEGMEEIFIREGRLHVKTSVGEVIEIKPYAYHPDSRKAIDAGYVLKGDTLTFHLNESYTGPIVLDPTFVFSTFTGSAQDNWGYSATFNPLDSTVYVAGIARGTGVYPHSPGAFDSIPDGGNDVAISRFSADGKTMIYSTYLGGSSVEQPSSIVADSTGKLAVLGSTGSIDFPTTLTAIDTTFNGGPSVTINNQFRYTDGVDLFVSVLSPAGDALYGSTLLGGTGSDGVNLQMAVNYGDQVRGEIIISPDGTILVASSTNSTDIPTVNAFQGALVSDQEGWVFETSLECDTLLWSTYYGGSGIDAGLAIRTSPSGIYLCGSSTSPTLLSSANGVYGNGFGGRDGFVALFDHATRACTAATFNGTPSNDMNFLMDIGPDGDVYVFGQSAGDYPTSPNAISETNSSVFVQQFNGLLTSDRRSLAFGNGYMNSLAISPTAFSVDLCGDVYLSGWGGSTNGVNSTTRNMYVTPDAFQDTTDGSDLYFAVIDASFRHFNYATFFGGLTNNEHVDGGTSRFDSRGVMYQAVCAGCAAGGSDDYPTFPVDVHSRVNGSSNCNLAVTVIAFEQQYAAVSVSVPDTVCSPFSLVLNDTISGADYVVWDFGGGDIDTSSTVPSRTYSVPGTYTISVVAIDTNCNTTDTATVEFEVVNANADASFQLSYDPCDTDLKAEFIPQNTGGSVYYWDFGDGVKDTTVGPVSHSYSNPISYIVTVIAESTNCFGSARDTVTEVITFSTPPEPPGIVFVYDGCAGGGEVALTVDRPGWDLFEWNLSDGQSGQGNYVIFNVATGYITVTLTVTDTLCNQTATVSETFEVLDDAFNFSTRVPNVFSPDGDGINDYFQLQEGFVPNSFFGFSIKIYDRWGKLLWESSDVSFKWPGTVDDKPLTEGAYFWIIRAASNCGAGIEENGIVHIMKDSQ